LIAFIDIRSILSRKELSLYHIIHSGVTRVPFWQKRKLRDGQATREKNRENPDLKRNNICNYEKHIEIFEKEVIIFGKCNRLSVEMQPSFSENKGSFHPGQRLCPLKSPALQPKKPADFLFLPPVGSKTIGHPPDKSLIG